MDENALLRATAVSPAGHWPVAEARDTLADRRDDSTAHGHRMASLASQLEAAEPEVDPGRVAVPGDGRHAHRHRHRDARHQHRNRRRHPAI